MGWLCLCFIRWGYQRKCYYGFTHNLRSSTEHPHHWARYALNNLTTGILTSFLPWKLTWISKTVLWYLKELLYTYRPSIYPHFCGNCTVPWQVSEKAAHGNTYFLAPLKNRCNDKLPWHLNTSHPRSPPVLAYSVLALLPCTHHRN